MWELFKDGKGHIHGARIAGFVYLLSLGMSLIAEGYSELNSRRFVARLAFTVGWWMAFCDKHPSRASSEFFNLPRTLGVILTVLGILAQFTFLRHR